MLIYEGALSGLLIGHIERPTAQARTMAEAILPGHGQPGPTQA